MAITWLSRTASNSQQTAAVQANAAGANIDVSPGSITLAFVQAVTGVALWLQGVALQVLALTRAATSNGTDLDSWMADFGLTRPAATFAAGNVTVSRANDATQAVVPIGAQFSTGPGGQTFTVVVNTSNGLYSAGAAGYVLPAGTPSGSIPVAATTAGTAGNVAANTLTSFYTPIPYIDTVTNASALSGGSAGQTDAQFRAAFPLYLASLSKATSAAISYVVGETPGVVSFSLTQNYDPNGTYDPGSFYVVIDDGTGALSGTSTLVNTVLTAVGATAGEGIRYSVLAATGVAANVVGALTTLATYNHAAIVTLVEAAVSAYIMTLPVGTKLSFYALSQVVLNASPGVQYLENLTLNGLTVDLAASTLQVIRPGSIVFT